MLWGKTFLIAVSCVMKCILYPGFKILICPEREKVFTVIYKQIIPIRRFYGFVNAKEYQKGISGFVEFSNGSRIEYDSILRGNRSKTVDYVSNDEFIYTITDEGNGRVEITREEI